ncbi:inactive pancreatic lipase-related protein 1-like, partial [Asbolus verrucosus]
SLRNTYGRITATIWKNFMKGCEFPEEVLKCLKQFISQIFFVSHQMITKNFEDLNMYLQFLHFVYKFCFTSIVDAECCEISAQLLKIIWDIASGCSADLVTNYKIDRENVYESGNNLYYLTLKKTGFWEKTFTSDSLVNHIKNFLQQKLGHYPNFAKVVKERYLEGVNVDDFMNLNTLLRDINQSICLQSSEKIRLYTDLIIASKKLKCCSYQDDIIKLLDIFDCKIEESTDPQDLFCCVLILDIFLIFIINYDYIGTVSLLEKCLHFIEKVLDENTHSNLDIKATKVLESFINSSLTHHRPITRYRQLYTVWKFWLQTIQFINSLFLLSQKPSNIANADLQLLKSLIERFLGVLLDYNVRPKTIEDLFVLFPCTVEYFYEILSVPHLSDSAVIVLLFFSESQIKSNSLIEKSLQENIDKFRRLFVHIIKNYSNNFGFLAIKAFTSLCSDGEIPRVYSEIVTEVDYEKRIWLNNYLPHVIMEVDINQLGILLNQILLHRVPDFLQIKILSILADRLNNKCCVISEVINILILKLTKLHDVLAHVDDKTDQDKEFLNDCIEKYKESISDDEILPDLSSTVIHLYKSSSIHNNYVGDEQLAFKLLLEFYCYVDELPDEPEESDTYYLIENDFSLPKQYIKKIILKSLSDVMFDADSLFSETTLEKLSIQFSGAFNYIIGRNDMRPLSHDVSFNLYTRKNPQIAQILPPNYSSLLRWSYFNSKLKTYFIIHGYTDHKHREIIARLRLVLNRSEDANVIVVDWARLAGLIYFNAVNHTLPVGNYVGQFLQFLENNSVDLKTVHIIGHSLGAHISGIAGACVGGRIGRITGLDPAGPLFELLEQRDASESLDKTDALFVDVIHTDSDEYGITKPIGHADFYPNEGTSPQPGCNNVLTVESVLDEIPFEARHCNVTQDDINCLQEKPVHMGHHLSVEARGIYFLETNAEPPFAKRIN